MYPTLRDDRDEIARILSKVQKIAQTYYDNQDVLAPSLAVTESLQGSLPG